jgi:hypothetical protein
VKNLGDIFSKKCKRLRACEFLKKHNVFHIDPAEYLRECRIFERNFAGVVLGRYIRGVNGKIVDANAVHDVKTATTLPLGHFGEIVYGSGEIWQRTGFYGFVDNCDRVWCCGKIEDSIFYRGEYFYPNCIEPVFETLFFVKSAKLAMDEKNAPTIVVTLYYPFELKFLRRHIANSLASFAGKFEKTKKLARVRIEG